MAAAYKISELAELGVEWIESELWNVGQKWGGGTVNDATGARFGIGIGAGIVRTGIG